MSEGLTEPSTAKSHEENGNSHGPQAPGQKRGPSVNQVYSQPIPIKTFPLPTFYPNNPLSILHIVCAWISQTYRPPPPEPALIHTGVWSVATNSVHVTDAISVRALWEHGFFGKGNLSRSEPNWLKREQVRRGTREGHVSELFTAQRRETRQQVKWERARLEQATIQSTKLKEAQVIAENKKDYEMLANAQPSPILAPVGPKELLALPNSLHENPSILTHESQWHRESHADQFPVRGSNASGASESNSSDTLTKTSDSAESLETMLSSSPERLEATKFDTTSSHTPEMVGILVPDAQLPVTPILQADSTSTKLQKSVRFSSAIEPVTLESPGSPSADQMTSNSISDRTCRAVVISEAITPALENGGDEDITAIVDMEHLQLTPEEAFFLTFGLGTLTIHDPGSSTPLTNQEILLRFRQNSTYPHLHELCAEDLLPNDNFLLHYAVYHHFRSLGWVPRAGIKFGVDWLLYTRGPVFDHAQYGIIVLPSYQDKEWKALGQQDPPKAWSWLHSVVRVLSHATKSLMLVYVDVPAPSKFNAALEGGITEALKLYVVREFMVKRWSSNRNR